MRAAAALVAIVCWAGLAIQFAATFANQRDLLSTLWILLRFFTVITNLLVALVMTGVALGHRASPFVLGGLTVAIILVGAVYVTLLRGLLELSGGALLADTLLHKLSPIAMAGWWLLYAPHGTLGWRAPLGWSLYPLLYFGYALARGASDGKYPYPFIDVGQLGWMQTVLNAAGIAIAFILAGLALVWLDRSRPLGSRRRSR